MSAHVALPRRVVATHDAELVARVVRRLPMRYAGGADPAHDRPAHVRAASGLAWVGSRLAVIQDDANFVALVDPATGLAEAIALPRGAGGRRIFGDDLGTKAHKLDHEALACIGDGDSALLVAFGSGSLPAREAIALVHDAGSPHASVRLHRAPAFYAALRAVTQFAGSELNIEGAVFDEGRMRLFGRGNGAVRDAARPVNATCDISWPALAAHLAGPAASPPPLPEAIVQYELGALAGAPLAFTDAATLRHAREGGGGAILFTAAAEASPDATRDGAVAGSVVGVIEGGDVRRPRWTPLVDVHGVPLVLKAEGIAPVAGRETRAMLVVDADAHDRPSELLEVQLEGDWVRART